MIAPLAAIALVAAVLIPSPEQPSHTERPPVRDGRQLAPEDEASLTRAYLEFSMRNFSDCLKALERGPIHPEALALRGGALLELGKKEEAAGMFQWALQLDPQHFWAQYNLAEIALLSGDLDRARKHFLMVPQSNPADRELVKLKLLLIDLRLNDEVSARRQLPEWPPASAAGYAAYAAMAHREGNEAQRAAILAESRRLYPDQWGMFLKKTLEESGVPAD